MAPKRKGRSKSLPKATIQRPCTEPGIKKKPPKRRAANASSQRETQDNDNLSSARRNATRTASTSVKNTGATHSVRHGSVRKEKGSRVSRRDDNPKSADRTTPETETQQTSSGSKKNASNSQSKGTNVPTTKSTVLSKGGSQSKDTKRVDDDARRKMCPAEEDSELTDDEDYEIPEKHLRKRFDVEDSDESDHHNDEKEDDEPLDDDDDDVYEDEIEGEGGQRDDDFADPDEVELDEEEDIPEDDDDEGDQRQETVHDQGAAKTADAADGDGMEILRKIEREDNGGRHLVSDEFLLLRRLITTLLGALTKRIDRYELTVQNMVKDLKKENSELHALVMTLHTLVGSKKNASKTRSERQLRLEYRTAILDCVVRDELVQNVLEKTMTGFLNKKLEGKSFDQFPHMGALALKTIFFAMKPRDRRSKYRTESGIQHSEFRLSLVLTLMNTLQYDRMGFFCHSGGGTSTDVPEHSTSKEAQNKLNFPDWLKPGYVSKKHFYMARDRRENTAQQDRVKRGKRKEIDREELCVHIGEKMYTIVTAILSKSRDTAKHSMFEDFAYLFCPWSSLGAKVSQESLVITWAAIQSRIVDYDDIPAMQTMDFMGRMDIMSQTGPNGKVHKENGIQLTKLIREHQHLVLIAEHDISIRVNEESNAPGRKKLAENLPTKRLVRPINLLDVACKLFSVYTGSASDSLPTTFVACDPNCLRIAFVIATALRDMLDKLVTEYQRNGVTKMGTPASYDKFAVNTLSLRELLPPTTKKRHLLNSNVLVLTAEEYGSRNADQTDDQGTLMEPGENSRGDNYEDDSDGDADVFDV